MKLRPRSISMQRLGKVILVGLGSRGRRHHNNELPRSSFHGDPYGRGHSEKQIGWKVLFFTDRHPRIVRIACMRVPKRRHHVSRPDCGRQVGLALPAYEGLAPPGVGRERTISFGREPESGRSAGEVARSAFDPCWTFRAQGHV